MRAPRETDLVKAVLQYLALRGGVAWRANTGAFAFPAKGGRRRFVRFGPPGQADVLGVLAPTGRLLACENCARRGVFLAVECKMPGRKLTAQQSSFLEMVRNAGGVALCVTSVRELEDGLKSEGY
jgi:hypothetical protein